MPAFKQLLREFWLPFAAAFLWTGYNVTELPPEQWSIRNFVNAFGPAFFFASWLIAQWYRVRKQQKVEGGLASIEASVKQTLAELEVKTTDLVAHITGGDSACYLSMKPDAQGLLTSVAVVHVGKHPLYEINVRMVDLEAFEAIKNDFTLENIQKTERCWPFGNLIPGHASMLNETIPLGDATSRNFNIFFTARNGSFTQLLRFRKFNDVWTTATKVCREDLTLYERVDEEFPRNANGIVEW
jgi:hypothetical protein